MKNILKVASRVQGAGVIQIPNHVQGHSGANGIKFEGVAVVTNLTAGATVSIVADGKEVLFANANGTHAFKFETNPRGHQETVQIDVALSNGGVCDIDVSLKV